VNGQEGKNGVPQPHVGPGLFGGQLTKVGHKVFGIHVWLWPVIPFELSPMQQLMFPKVV